jgi:hypothetical protein
MGGPRYLHVLQSPHRVVRRAAFLPDRGFSLLSHAACVNRPDVLPHLASQPAQSTEKTCGQKGAGHPRRRLNRSQYWSIGRVNAGTHTDMGHLPFLKGSVG